VLRPTPSLLSLAPSLLPLKRPYSLFQTNTTIADPKFGVYIIDIYTSVNGQDFEREEVYGEVSLCNHRVLRSKLSDRKHAKSLTRDCFLLFEGGFVGR